MKNDFRNDPRAEPKTADPEMMRLLQLAGNVAGSRATVLITGESGVGKEVFANYIHVRSPRSTRRLVAVNCAAVPADQLEGELFGIERATVFGSTHQSKLGKFELATNSTILLDEVCELPLGLQAKLLRVIQEGEIERLGGKAPIKINVRIIATSTRDLAQMVRVGEFREDLYYRLNVIPLVIPSLRKRPRDIETLAHYFTEISGLVNGRAGRKLAACAIEKLKNWCWPGNVRELENVIERSVLISDTPEITAHAIEMSEAPNANGTVTGSNVPAGDLTPGMTIGEAEQKLIMKTLEYTSQNRTKAAQLLGISIRTLRNKLHEYGVSKTLDEETQNNG